MTMNGRTINNDVSGNDVIVDKTTIHFNETKSHCVALTFGNQGTDLEVTFQVCYAFVLTRKIFSPN